MSFRLDRCPKHLGDARGEGAVSSSLPGIPGRGDKFLANFGLGCCPKYTGEAMLGIVNLCLDGCLEYPSEAREGYLGSTSGKGAASASSSYPSLLERPRRGDQSRPGC